MEIEEYKSIVLPIRPLLLGIARKITNNDCDAEDIVQDVLLKTWSIRDRLGGAMKIEPYCITMVKNLSVDYLRKRRLRIIDEHVEAEGDGVVLPDEIMEIHERAEAIRAMIAMLPPLQQTIIRMKDIEGYETEEIAVITQTKVEAVRNNLSRARKRIRALYLVYSSKINRTR